MAAADPVLPAGQPSLRSWSPPAQPPESPWRRRRAALRSLPDGREWPLSSMPFSIGGAASCDLSLTASKPLVACIVWLEGHHVLFDCAAGGSLAVDGTPLLAPRVLLPGDRLELAGAFSLEYVPDPALAAAAASQGESVDAARAAVEAPAARGAFGIRAVGGPLAGPDFLFFRPVVLLGTSESCSLRLADPATAQEHAVFLVYGKGAIVYPKGGELAVNGDPTPGPVSISAGDRVALPSGQQLELFRADARPDGLSDSPLPAARLACTLAFESGERAGQSHAVRQKAVTLGRSLSCDFVFQDAGVSVEHAVIRSEDDGWWLVPNGLEPTLLNGEPLTVGAELLDGDRIALPGDNVLQFRAQGRPAGAGDRRRLDAGDIARTFGVERSLPWALRKVRGPWAGPPGEVVAYFDAPVVKIGRGETCDLVLGDRSVSRIQLIVRSEGGKLVAEDQGLVPCQVDGEPLERKRELANGSRIAIGKEFELAVALGLRKPETPEGQRRDPRAGGQEKKSDLWIYAGLCSILTTVLFLAMAFLGDDEGLARKASLASMPERELAWLAVESFGDEYFTPEALEAASTGKGRLRFTRDDRELHRARRMPRALGPGPGRSVEALKVLAAELQRSASVLPEGYRHAFRALHEAIARASHAERPGLQRLFDQAAEGYVELLAMHFFRAQVCFKQRDYDAGRAEYRQILQLIGQDTNPGYKATGFLLLELERAAAEERGESA